MAVSCVHVLSMATCFAKLGSLVDTKWLIIATYKIFHLFVCLFCLQLFFRVCSRWWRWELARFLDRNSGILWSSGTACHRRGYADRLRYCEEEEENADVCKWKVFKWSGCYVRVFLDVFFVTFCHVLHKYLVDISLSFQLFPIVKKRNSCESFPPVHAVFAQSCLLYKLMNFMNMHNIHYNYVTRKHENLSSKSGGSGRPLYYFFYIKVKFT